MKKEDNKIMMLEGVRYYGRFKANTLIFDDFLLTVRQDYVHSILVLHENRNEYMTNVIKIYKNNKINHAEIITLQKGNTLRVQNNFNNTEIYKYRTRCELKLNNEFFYLGQVYIMKKNIFFFYDNYTAIIIPNYYNQYMIDMTNRQHSKDFWDTEFMYILYISMKKSNFPYFYNLWNQKP